MIATTGSRHRPSATPHPYHAPARNALPHLTPREREVADLIAEGLTNRQIAEHPVISKRTADTQVVRILTELGVTSRTHIAAAMGAQESPQSEQ